MGGSAAFLVAVLLVASAAASDDEPFIGWRGETYRPNQPDAEQPGEKRKWVETISWSPRAFVYHNFLSDEEVDHIIQLVEHEVTRSAVVDTKTGQHTVDKIRTSYGAPLMRGQTPTIAAIEARIAEWTRLPPDHGEPIQVLRYQDGQKYAAHWDWFDDPSHPRDTGENRAATVLLYLAEVEEGGETALPLGRFIDEGRQRPPNASECAKEGSGMAVVPQRGDALLFWDMHVDGVTVDRSSLHASCPTIKGTKWTATKWIHNKPYGTGFDPLLAAAQCRDAGTSCAALAAAGKCDSEPREMLGVAGKCRRTCQDCEDCAQHDIMCLRRNMRSQRARLAQQQQQPA